MKLRLSAATLMTLGAVVCPPALGKNMTTTMATKGKWLAASCGDVKPPVVPPAMKKP